LAGYKDLVDRGCREFSYVACCDTNEANAQERAAQIQAIQGGPAPRIFTSVEEMLKADIADAADTCLPHCFHHTIGIELLEHGLHVMCEKPTGITVAASRKMIETAKRNNRILAAAENIRRYLPPRACKWALTEAKLIGDLQAVQIHFINNKPFDLTQYAMRWRVVKDLSGGGMIMDGGAHFTDMMLHLFGDVDTVSCVMRVNDCRPVEDIPVLASAKADVEDAWHAVIQFKSGLYTTWTYARCFPGESVSTGLYYGTTGMMKDQGYPFHCFQGGGNVVRPDGKVISREQIQQDYLMQLPQAERERLFPYGCTNGFGIEIWDFCDAIRNNRKPEMDGEDGLRAKALCEACYESATIGAPVKFDDVLSGKVNAYQKPIDEFWKL
jgi:predicted dehydrogenase